MRDGAGTIVRESRWGSLSSRLVLVDPATGRRTAPTPSVTLEPGETYPVGFDLFALGNHLDVPPDSNRLEAVFHHDDLGAFPEPCQHSWPGRDRSPSK
jgi:hypothetical protein